MHTRRRQRRWLAAAAAYAASFARRLRRRRRRFISLLSNTSFFFFHLSETSRGRQRRATNDSRFMHMLPPPSFPFFFLIPSPLRHVSPSHHSLFLPRCRDTHTKERTRIMYVPPAPDVVTREAAAATIPISPCFECAITARRRKKKPYAKEKEKG